MTAVVPNVEAAAAPPAEEMPEPKRSALRFARQFAGASRSVPSGSCSCW